MNYMLRGLSIERISPRERRVVFAGALIVASSLIHTHVISPFLAAAAGRRNIVHAEREALARQRELVRGSETTAAQIERASTVLRTAVPRVFSSPEDEGGTVSASVAIDAYVERLATEAGVRVVRISAQSDSVMEARDALLRVDVTVAGAASIQALTDFLEWIERGEKLVRVSRIRLLGRSTDISGGSINFELELHAFILIPLVIGAPSALS